MGGSFFESSTCPPFRSCALDKSLCWDSDDPDSQTSISFIYIYCLAYVGLSLIIYSETEGYIESRFQELNKKEETEEETERSDELFPTAFLDLKRSEDNFIRSHGDMNLQLPSVAYPPEYEPISIQRSVMPVRGFRAITSQHKYLAATGHYTVFLGSLGIACLCSAFSSLLWMLVHYEHSCSDSTAFSDWTQNIGGGFSQVIDDYAYFPIFLLVGQISFTASRWRNFMVNCHSIQGCVQDIGMLCGGCLTKTATLAHRKQLYIIYRYLNAIHALTYNSVSPSLSVLDLDDYCTKLGFLTEDEVDKLFLYENKARDMLLAMLTIEVAKLMQMDDVNSMMVNDTLSQAITRLRATFTEHHDLFVRDNPNFYITLMFIVVNIMIFFYIISYPFSLAVYTPAYFPGLTCVQPVTFIGVFLLLFAFRSAFSMITNIRNPFSWTADRIKVESLLASSDSCIFATLRANFDGPSMVVLSSIPEENTENEKEDDEGVPTPSPKRTSRISLPEETSENDEEAVPVRSRLLRRSGLLSIYRSSSAGTPSAESIRLNSRGRRSVVFEQIKANPKKERVVEGSDMREI
eukprot:scaffold527263_cov63-Attheya_sp.AAC.1